MRQTIHLGCLIGSVFCLSSCSKGEADSSWAPPPDSGTVDASIDAPGDGGASDAAGPCVAKTCVQLGATCGAAPDGCGGKLACGECSAGQACGGGGANRCGSGTCQVRTCAQAGASCGQISDGCSDVIDCGSCVAPDTCGGAGVAGQCGCGCSLPHAQTSCLAGGCSLVSCDSGYADCNADEKDGCEVELAANSAHCGSCGHACSGNPCAGGQTCQGGACVSGVPVTCDSPPNASCYEQKGECQPSDGTCAYKPLADGLSCGNCLQCKAGTCGKVPADCAGKACGDDGCGNDCGGCPTGKTCSGNSCVCDPALPTGWPASISPWTWNPMLLPTPSAQVQGADNVYAPEIHFADGAYAMFYGAQGGDGHDQIFLAWSSDGQEWRKYPTDQSPSPVLAGGGSNHVNDPSVVRAGATWRMYYTDAPTGENDRIWLAEGAHVHGFQKKGEVLGPVPGTWEADKVGRPAVLLENGVYKMWYDGAANGQRHVGFAWSNDGVSFTRHPGNPVFMNAGAIDVKKVGGVYVMLREGGDGTYWATSVDGLCWVDRGKLFGLSGKAYDAFGQVTPFLQVEGDALKAVWFGGASVSSWNKNRIAVAFPGGASVPSGGGCTGCVPSGWSCSAACQNAGAAALGTCGAPGSTSPGSCCGCSPEGCEGCTTHPDCHAACVAAGRGGGWCAVPGSGDPSNCCACLP